MNSGKSVKDLIEQKLGFYKPINICYGHFSCSDNSSLTSLEGCPKEVGGYFWCYSNSSLTSLKGCPKEVGGDFYCYNNSRKFTKEEVRKVCNVKGDVYI
jgi:hypothetical protein